MQHLIFTREVMKRTGLSWKSLRKLLRKKKFPEPSLPTRGGGGWKEDDIHHWIMQELEKGGGK